MDSNIIERKWIQGITAKPDSLLGQAFTGEEGAHVFRISGETTGGAAVPITGTIVAKFLRSDNITVPLSGSVSDGVAVVTLTDECYLVPGRFIFSIYVIQGDLRMCIYCGVGNVFRTDSGEYEGGQIITDITELINEIQEAVESIPPDYSELTGEVADLKSAVIDPQGNVIHSADLKGEIDELQSEYLVYEKNNDISVVNIGNTMPGNIAVTVTPHNENRFQPNPYGEPTSVTKNGVTFTRDENGVLTIDGTPSAFTRYYYIAAASEQKFPNENGNVVISFVSNQPISLEYYYDATPSSARPYISRKTYGKMVVDTKPYADYDHIVIDLYLITGVEYKNCKVYVAFEIGEESHNDVICAVNKNLISINDPIRLDSTYQTVTSGIYHGVLWSVDYDEGTITLDGTADTDFYITFFQYQEKLVPIAPGTLCMLSGSETSGSKYWCYVTFKDENNNTLFSIKDTYKSNTLISKEYHSISSGIHILSGAVLNNVVFTPMLEIGKQRSSFVKQELQMYNPFFGETNTLRSYNNSTSLFSRTGALSFSATVPISYTQYSQSILGSDLREITVCTYNVGVWNYGDRNNPLYHGNDLPGVISLLKQFLVDGSIDVLAMQEYRDFIDPEKTYRTITELFEPVFSEYFRGNTSEIVFSRYLFQNRFKGYIGDSVNRGYMVHDIIVGSTTVRIINTHLIYNDASERIVQMQHIVDRALTDYTVILGDFNVHDSSEYAPFTNAGLIPANGGYFGEFITTKTSGGKYDNIWVTPNIQIVNVWQADLHDSPDELDIPSDHLPLLAKLLIHGTTTNTDSEDWEEN